MYKGTLHWNLKFQIQQVRCYAWWIYRIWIYEPKYNVQSLMGFIKQNRWNAKPWTSYDWSNCEMFLVWTTHFTFSMDEYCCITPLKLISHLYAFEITRIFFLHFDVQQMKAIFSTFIILMMSFLFSDSALLATNKRSLLTVMKSQFELFKYWVHKRPYFHTQGTSLEHDALKSFYN